MTFIEDWYQVLLRAWRVRLMALAAILSGAEAALPLLGDLLPPEPLALLSAVATTGALVARFLVQRDFHHGT